LQQRKKINGRQCQGRFLFGKDGLPATQVWAHCDDFVIHACFYLQEDGGGFGTTVPGRICRSGILCHPGKLIPPAHIIKYTGLLFNMTNQPALRIPTEKREQSLAMIDYFLSRDKPFPWHALAVLISVLESVVTDATPAHQGHTHL
jgi:hypothetical protein